MANIKLNNNSYPIPDSVLAGPTADFVAHLGTIAGDGLKVVVGGVEYGVDATKVAGAVADIEAVLAGTSEERLEGDGQEFYTMAPSTLSFRSTAPLSELQDVQINGQTVDPSNYELEEGSTVVKLKYDYLSTFDVGKYELSVVSDSKTVKGDFTVAAPELNEHGFYYNQPYSASVDLNGNGEPITYTIWFTSSTQMAGITSTGKHAGLAYTTYSYENSVVTFNSLGDLSFSGSFSSDGKEIHGTSIIDPSLAFTFKLTSGSLFSDDLYAYIKHDNYVSYTPLNPLIYEYPLPKTNICGLSVSSLNEAAFARMPIASVLLPESLTSIPDFAFYNCASLLSITIPSSVTSIGDNAFYGCMSLRDIVIPNGVTTIGNGAFGKSTLETVTIPSSLTSLGDRPFNMSMQLKTVNYDGTVEQAKTVLASLLSTYWKDIGTYTVYCTDGKITNRGTVTMY